jgi:UBX domain-containing protein 1/4
MKSSESIVEAIDLILKSQSSSSPAASSTTQQFLSAEVASSSSSASQQQSDEIVCEGDVCYKKEKKPETEIASEPSNDKTEEEIEAERQEKIRHAMKMIEEKRAEKVKEEEQKEKEREIQRRKEGQELIKLKQWKDEQELKQLKEDRLKEKMEAQAARKRVLDQIAQDKMERAQRFQQFSSSSAEQSSTSQPQATTTPPTPPPNSTRIQFKKPDGESEIVTFETSMLFADLHAFVKSDVLQGSNIKNFSLATTFPRREFTSEDFNKTLIDLNLVPSSVILIIPIKGKSASSSPASNVFNPSSVLPTQTDGSFFDMISALIMGLFSPVFALFAYVGRIISGNRNNNEDEGFGDVESDVGKRKRNEDVLTPNDAAKRRNLNSFFTPPSTDDQPGTSSGNKTAYKRGNQSGNIHRLHEDSDSEEDRKTWNGNSTQQM